MAEVTLVTGGSRSGKSRYAMELALEWERRVFIATAQVTDGEMEERIERHRRERGDLFVTVEEPLDLAGAIGSLPLDTGVALVDCLTVWLGNLFHHLGDVDLESPQIGAFLEILEDPPFSLILVTNEVGMGLVPPDALSRRFRDVAGLLNQEVARRAHRVVFTVCGIPMVVKG